MWNRCCVVITSVLIVAVVQTLFSQANVIRMSESGTKRIAIERTMPVFPAESVKRGSAGVAVAALTGRPDGSVAEVTILEAPDAAIGAAVKAAVLKWRFGPISVASRDEPYGVQGKVTFYFRIVSGQGRVLNPEDIPGGPKPEPAFGPPPGGPRAGRAPGSPPGAAPTADMGHAAAPDIEIGDAQLRDLIATSRPVVLDIRERDEFARRHRPDAVNIPRDELAVRAYIELDRSRPVVIDCSAAETRQCHSAATSLLRGPGIKRVYVFIP